MRKVQRVMLVESTEAGPVAPTGRLVATYNEAEFYFDDDEFQTADEAGRERYKAAKLRIGTHLQQQREMYLDAAQNEISAFKIHGLQNAAAACAKLWKDELAKITAQKLLERVELEGPLDMAAWVGEYCRKHFRATRDFKPAQRPEGQDRRAPERRPDNQQRSLMELMDEEPEPPREG